MKQLLLTVAITLAGVAASAAEFSTAVGGETGRLYLTFDGPVEAGDAMKLREHAAANPDHNWLSLSSPGGLANEGYELGFAISELGLNTYIPYGSACLSACYTAFIGGTNYDVDGLLAAHNSWVQEADGNLSANDFIKLGQQFGSYDSYYHLVNGFNASLPYYITIHTDPETFIGFTHEDDLNRFFARTERDTVDKYLEWESVDEAWLAKHIVDPSNIQEKTLEGLNRDRPDHLDPRN